MLTGLKELDYPTNLVSEIAYTEYGRPYLSIPLNFSISHSDILVYCGITQHVRIGVDVEKIRDIDICEFDDQFNDWELQAINGASDKYKEFFRYWTIKEALVKADGRGLSLDLKNIKVDNVVMLDKSVWFVRPIESSPDYMAHLASDSPIDQLIYKKVVLP